LASKPGFGAPAFDEQDLQCVRVTVDKNHYRVSATIPINVRLGYWTPGGKKRLSTSPTHFGLQILNVEQKCHDRVKSIIHSNKLQIAGILPIFVR